MMEGRKEKRGEEERRRNGSGGKFTKIPHRNGEDVSVERLEEVDSGNNLVPSALKGGISYRSGKRSELCQNVVFQELGNRNASRSSFLVKEIPGHYLVRRVGGRVGLDKLGSRQVRFGRLKRSSVNVE